jgi:hypothetical protein
VKKLLFYPNKFARAFKSSQNGKVSPNQVTLVCNQVDFMSISLTSFKILEQGSLNEGKGSVQSTS